MAQIKNRQRLKKKMLVISPVLRAAIIAPMEQGADQVVSIQRHLVHVRPGSGPHLRDYIDWTWGKAPRGAMTSVNKVTQATAQLLITIFAGGPLAYWARWLEFGTRPGRKHQRTSDARHRTRIVARTHPGAKAAPFFWPGWRAMKKQVKSRIARAGSAAIKKLAKSS